MPKKAHDDSIPLDDLKRRAARATALIAELRALFPEAHAMPLDARRHSTGKFDADQSHAFAGVIDAIELKPDAFNDLADEDDGHDPNKLETALLRDRLARHDLYGSVGEQLAALSEVISDAALTVGAQVRPVLLAAYAIGKPLSKRNEPLREKLKPMLDYFKTNAQAAADARHANATTVTKP